MKVVARTDSARARIAAVAPQGDRRHRPRPPDDAGHARHGDRGGPGADAARAEPRRAPGGQGARDEPARRRPRARAGARRVPRAPAGDADAAPADFDERIRTGDLDVVLEIDAAFADDVANGKAGTVRLAYDRSRDRARASIAEVEALLRAYNREWGRGRLLLRGVAVEVANPLNVESRDLATPQSSGALVLFLIAFYGLFAAVMGGMAAALDTTAGERERASLEPLLTTPVAPLELATGKWLAVVALNATAVVLTLSGFYLILRFAPLPAVGIPFLFGLTELGRFVVALVPLIAPDAGDPALRRLPRPVVQGSAVEPVGAAVRRVADPDRADVPATQGARRGSRGSRSPASTRCCRARCAARPCRSSSCSSRTSCRVCSRSSRCSPSRGSFRASRCSPASSSGVHVPGGTVRRRDCASSRRS